MGGRPAMRHSASRMALRWVRLAGCCWLVKPLPLLRAGVKLRKVKPKLCSQTVLGDSCLFVLTPSVTHTSDMRTRLCSMELRFRVRFFSTIFCRTDHNWKQPPFGSPFELTGVRLVASELASVQCHRLIWTLAWSKPDVRIIRISELTSLYCTGLCKKQVNENEYAKATA